MECICKQRVFIYFLNIRSSWWWPSRLAEVNIEDLGQDLDLSR